MINPQTGEIIDSPDQLVKLWVEATAAEKEAKKTLDFCKDALFELDIPLKVPVYKGYGVVQVERRNLKYDKSALRKVLDEDMIEVFSEIDKVSLEKWLKEAGSDFAKDAKECLVEKSPPTKYFQLKKLDNA